MDQESLSPPSVSFADVGYRLPRNGPSRNAPRTQGAKFARDAASLTRSAAAELTYQEYGDKVGRTACPLRLAIPRRALTSAILARLTGTRCGVGPSSSTIAPSPSFRTKVTCGIATIWLRCTRTNRPGLSWASASEIDHGHIRSRVPSCTLV